MNKKGFTLIELLAVIIILGVLMIIAVPAVTKYIDNSRKSGYVSTAKNIANGVRNLINSGSLDLNDKNITYYVDAECIKLDNGYKSPYGDFDKAYVVVTASYDNYEYYWTSVDTTGTGVKNIININRLDIDDIETDISPSDITTNRGLDEREYILVVDSNCQKQARTQPEVEVNSLTGKRNVICQRATTLHTKVCERTSNGCGATVGNGNTITYGTIPNGAPKAGDAYDCDVNNDKIYDSATERFYYVKSDGANSILIYYTNMDDQTMYAYHRSNINWYGPSTGYQYLPSTSTWSNPLLIAPGTRQIVTETGETSTVGGTIEPFTYTGKAARLLTTQELASACSSYSSIGGYENGELNDCVWAMENIGRYERESGTRSYGYWLETPRYNYTYHIEFVSGDYSRVYFINASSASSNGIRPVITVPTAYLE